MSTPTRVSKLRPKPLSPQEKRFTVQASITISLHTTVVATSKAKAIEHARNQELPSLCHQCAGGDPLEHWVTSGEFDGEPVDLEAEAE